MPVHFNCWGCGKSLKARDEHAGKRCKCTGCDRVNDIPAGAVKALPIKEPVSSTELDELSVLLEEEEPVVLKPEKKTPKKDSGPLWPAPGIPVKKHSHSANIVKVVLALLAFAVLLFLVRTWYNPTPRPQTPREWMELTDAEIDMVLDTMSEKDVERFFHDWYDIVGRFRNPVDVRDAQHVLRKIWDYQKSKAEKTASEKK